MTFEQAAARLGTTVHRIAGIDDHPAGSVVRLFDGSQWLVTDTVVRRYVPDVDDPPATAGELEDAEDDQDAAVPTGTADQVLEWVGEDRERAARALAAEQARSSPRKTVVARLEALAAEEA